MTKKLIVANWKMNPSTEKEARELFDAVKNGVKNTKNAEVVICPPFIYLPLLQGLSLGAQNISFKEKGAFTGEVSPKQIKDLGVEYVIVGHSEARKNLNETNEIINKKLKEALTAKLKPILCVGEQEGEDKLVVLEEQLTRALHGIVNLKSKILNLVIAYEPVWAIGTGKNCSVEETIQSVLLIKKIIAKINKDLVDGVKILYGGSVNSINAGSYLAETNIDGLLVGGASLNAGEFIKIVKSAPGV